MIEIVEKMKCSGCSACFNVCPVKAIEMVPDHEGFLYPCVDYKKCIHCNLCDKTCPYITKVERKIDLEKCYAAYNKNSEEREKSSSGGIFVLLAKEILKRKGIIFGAAYDDEFLVYHKSSEDNETLKDLIGSKYMQSRIGNVFLKIKNELQNGRDVLFVGSSCQVGGLRGFLKKDYPNLICVDFICLGVPSPKVWKDYLETFFSSQKIEFVNFKNKDLGWHKFSLNIKTDRGNYCKNGKETYFFSGYFKQLYSRPSCSECIFKNGNRVSDITISDCWGFRQIASEIDDNKGLSSIECHTQKGVDLFADIQNELIWKKSDINLVKIYNSNYCTSAPMGEKRKEFWDNYDLLPKKKLFRKYCVPKKESITIRIKNKIKRVIKRH